MLFRSDLLDRVHKSALIYAAGQGHSDVVNALLAAGSPVDAVHHNDLTPMMWAAAYGHSATVAMLLERGADPKRRDNRGKTAIDMARDGKHEAVVKLLASKTGQ